MPNADAHAVTARLLVWYHIMQPIRLMESHQVTCRNNWPSVQMAGSSSRWALICGSRWESGKELTDQGHQQE
jgi:hypothetical protein